jgi:hypothetical protein
MYTHVSKQCTLLTEHCWLWMERLLLTVLIETGKFESFLFMIRLDFTKYCYGNHIKGDEMAWACGIYSKDCTILYNLYLASVQWCKYTCEIV